MDESAWLEIKMNHHLIQMREYSARSAEKPKKLIDGFTFKEPLQSGWILPYLLELESMEWGRWNHWSNLVEANNMTDAPIPQIEWCSGDRNSNPARKMLERSLNSVTKYGDWHGWSGSLYFEYFINWLLFAFGHSSQSKEPTPPGGCEGASERLYQIFDLAPLLAFPYDYFGDMLAESGYGKAQGFFPTPIDVCEMMVRMQMEGEEMRDKTVCDPALGTGRMLLCASNHSYRLYGNDVLQIMCYSTLVNGYLYAPWLVKPFGFFNQPSAEPEQLQSSATEFTVTAPKQLELIIA